MRKHPYLLMFLLAAAYFGWVHAVPAFGDPDAAYHLELARRTAASGPVLDFPWLPFTTLADHFADHHFLYHAALAPFVSVFGDFLGLKIATVVFAALAVAAFLFLLKAYDVKRPFLWTLPMFLAPDFVFRLLLTKATALALAAFFLFLAALRGRNRLAVFGIAFAYVWLHGGWPILLVAALIHDVVSLAGKFHGRGIFRQTNATPLVLGGLATGLVVNPFFPENLSFYREQIVQVALLGRSDPGVRVGAEWYPADVETLFIGNGFISVPLLAGVAAFGAAIWTKQAPRAGSAPESGRRRDIVFAFTLAFLFLLMTLRQARHLEYSLPLLLLAGALVAETAFAAVDLRATWARSKACWGRLFAPLLAVSCVFLGAAAAFALHEPRRVYEARPAWTRYAGASAWTRAHVPEGDVIFHARWDDFPQLFYRDPDHRYIAGLDALFLYRKDPEKYWLWRDIGDGRRRDRLADLIENEFDARYVFVRMEPGPLRSLIKKDPSFERVYADSEAEVWRIKPARR